MADVQPIKNIVQLRQLLAERFPNLRMLAEQPPTEEPAGYLTGLPQIDALLRGGLPKGAITELVSPKVSSGSALLIIALLRQAHETHQWVGLIDGQDSFDPASLNNEILSRLLWIRCRNADQALKAADLLLRDGNLPLVLLDLEINPAAQLRKIPSTTWYRLQRLIEQTSTALLVVAPHTMVSSAQARLVLESSFTLEAVEQRGEELLAQLKIRRVQKRSSANETPTDGGLMAEAS